ncbi:hypothetical protein AVEN_113475-1 [Araneus ventricosus]|uniref:Uncharacterized protein n=1 Tax=Araneus ventricosus TaxID=182803 RepID=A0A4Y2KNH9_ARAVE|nr:hypothetical protein AVEN_113475-1 [Araneus ventricosus]
MHGQCPMGIESWCRYQRAVSNGIKYQDETQGLPKNIMKIVKPVYMQLYDRELLKRFLDGKTQNANEAFNGLIWRYIPKETFDELNILKLGINMAAIQFNKGFNGF